jgi:hypothetical protein
VASAESGSRFARPVADFLTTVPVPAERKQFAAEMSRDLELDHAGSRAAGFRLSRRRLAELTTRASRCQDTLTALDRHLDSIRHAPAVDTIFGAKRIGPLVVDPDREPNTGHLESWDPVAFPELSVLPGVARFAATLRMMLDAYARIEPVPEEPVPEEPERDIEDLLAVQRVFGRRPPGFEYAADAARRTSSLREIGYRADCLEQEGQWHYQVSELRQIIDYLEPDARERTVDYMLVDGRLADACRLLSGNRDDGFAAWNETCLNWGEMFLGDLRDWIGRRADGTDRADGSDFPFADILNKMPDFTDVPKLPEDRDEHGR